MNILVTGGEGFIGSHLKKAIRVKTYDLKKGQDIFNTEKLLKSLKGIDTVIHLAALVSPEGSLHEPGKYYSTNISGLEKVIRTAIKSGVRNFIFSSSAAVYEPKTPYGLSKLIGEQILQTFKDDIKVIILRFFNVYGEGQNPHYAGVVLKYLEAARNKEPLYIYGTGTQSRDFIHIDDIVSIIKQITERIDKVKSGTVLELGTSRSITINNLANFFSKRFNLPIEYKYSKNSGILKSKANNKELIKLLDRYQFCCLENGLENIIRSVLFNSKK